MKPFHCVPLFVGVAVLPTSGQSVLSIQQFGSNAQDECESIAFDSAGNVHSTGYTEGNLAGPHAGLKDVFLSKHDPAGVLLWARQLGTAGDDSGAAVTVDGTNHSYVAGTTHGNLAGPSLGLADMFVAKHDANGTLVWAIQHGTPSLDAGSGVAVDGLGNVYATGWTEGSFGGPNAGATDAFLVKFDPFGALLWARQLGSSAHDDSSSVAIDAVGNVYTCGTTYGNIAGPHAGNGDVFVAKYDPTGTVLWVRQFGTEAVDFGMEIALDSAGNALIGISTAGALGGVYQSNVPGHPDVSLAKLDPSGTLMWVRQIGTPGPDWAIDVAADSANNAYVSGFTNESLGGPSAGFVDAFLLKYDPLGNPVWTRQLGTSNWDSAATVAVDPAGDVYIGGFTDGSLAGVNAGLSDAFLAKLDNSCTSAFSYCAAKVSSSGCLPAMSASGVASLSEPNSFLVTANALEQGQNGIMFFGTTGPALVPFQGGSLCVTAPWYRLGAQNSGGSGACSGSISQKLTDMLADPQGGPLLVVNQSVNIQTWFRDPPSPSQTGLSNGLQVGICP